MHLSIRRDAQAEMRHAFYDGAPGMLVSALVWFVAAYVCHRLGFQKGVWALLIGGVLIHPISTIITKAAGRSAKTARDNALPQLAFATTIWLIVCCAMAYGLSLFKPQWFFPAMMGAIGGRYLVFSTLFGNAVYWVCGGTLIASGVLSGYLPLPPPLSALLGGSIELAFSLAIFLMQSKETAV